MPLKPTLYLQRYKPVAYERCSYRPMGFAHIASYRSSFKNGSGRHKAQKDLTHFFTRSGRFDGGANGADHDYISGGFIMSPHLTPNPWMEFPTERIKQMFQGIGRPIDFAALLKLVDLYLFTASFDEPALKALGWPRAPKDATEYCDWFFGLDCRGFVGAYLSEEYPHIKDTATDFSFYIDGYAKIFKTEKAPYGSAFTRVDDPKDVTEGCLLVKVDAETDEGERSGRHVALIDTVSGTATAKTVYIKTAESRGHSDTRTVAPGDDSEMAIEGPMSLEGVLTRLTDAHKGGDKDRNWKHRGCNYNLVLKPRKTPGVDI